MYHRFHVKIYCNGGANASIQVIMYGTTPSMCLGMIEKNVSMCHDTFLTATLIFLDIVQYLSLFVPGWKMQYGLYIVYAS